MIASEDKYAVKQYFGCLRIRGVQVKVLPTEDCRSSPTDVVKRLRDFRSEFDLESDDELWVFLDVDHHFTGTHLKATTAALRRAKTIQATVALSNPCFELWLLLHHADPRASYASCDAVSDHIRAVLGSYNKTGLKPERYSVETVRSAVRRAKTVGSEPTTTMGTDVWRLMEKLAARMSETAAKA
ncbi:MAG: RloB domain-containing protein [Nannocystaceae bacterium]|nr:RloB domain-containing protein [Nannocystaceae bacterium]